MTHPAFAAHLLQLQATTGASAAATALAAKPMADTPPAAWIVLERKPGRNMWPARWTVTATCMTRAEVDRWVGSSDRPHLIWQTSRAAAIQWLDTTLPDELAVALSTLPQATAHGAWWARPAIAAE